MTHSLGTMSWERDVTSKPGHRSKEEELLVFGYAAKLFKDDEKARLVDSGRHLVPFQGRPDILIDRFDVRGCLSSLTPYEGRPVELTPSEKETERLLDEERFRDLIPDEVVDAQEEEMKRLREELAAEGAYSQVAFDYGDKKGDTTCDPHNGNDSEPADFVLPNGLILREKIETPKTMKHHRLIEKTAAFILKHGPQMEIVLKLKQSSNPAFSFLNFDSPLNQYFKFLLSEMKTGRYVSGIKQEKQSLSEDSGSDDETVYLHPSLMGKSNVTSAKEMPSEVPNALPVVSSGHESASSSVIPVPNQSKSSKFSLLPPPPLELEKVIDKLAEKVAEAGDEFELSIKRRADPRFDFLIPGNCFHAFYIKRKLHFIEELRMKQSKLPDKPMKCPEVKNSSIQQIPFSLKVSADKKDVSQVRNDADCQKESLPQEDPNISQEKKLQEERKRKVAIFLKLMKSKESVVEPEEKDEKPFTHSPDVEIETRKETTRRRVSRSPDRHRHDRHDKERRRRRTRSRSRSRERDRKHDRRRHRSRSHKRSHRRSRSRSR